MRLTLLFGIVNIITFFYYGKNRQQQAETVAVDVVGFRDAPVKNDGRQIHFSDFPRKIFSEMRRNIIYGYSASAANQYTSRYTGATITTINHWFFATSVGRMSGVPSAHGRMRGMLRVATVNDSRFRRIKTSHRAQIPNAELFELLLY